MIKLKNIDKTYSGQKVLSKIDTKIQTGTINAFLGPNGSGKTTILKIILGLVKPDRGEIYIDDKLINKDWKYREQIGYMAQIANFPDNLTGTDLLNMVVKLRKQNPVYKDELISAFNLEDSLRKQLKSLSGGTKQKINAVMALMFDVGILILDEPTVGLDPEASIVLKKFILGQREMGKSIIFSSHVLYDIEELSEQVFVILEGREAFRGTLEEMKTNTDSQGLEEALVKIARRRHEEKNV